MSKKMYYCNYFVERSVIFLNVDKLAVPTTTQHNKIQVNDEDDVSRHRDCSVHHNKEWYSTYHLMDLTKKSKFRMTNWPYL